MTASSSSSSAKNQSHAAASDHPRQSAEVGVDVGWDALFSQSSVELPQCLERSRFEHVVQDLDVEVIRDPGT